MESHTACVGWGMLRAHAKMEAPGAGVPAEELLGGRACAPCPTEGYTFRDEQ